jgi:hypothetical protein
MTEPHFTDDQLDRLAREAVGGSASPPDEHLMSCQACKAKSEFLVAFYAQLEEELRKPPLAVIGEAMSGTRRSAIRLHYFRPSPDLAPFGVVEPSMLLAAQTVSETHATPCTVATYVSETDRVVGRITRISGKGEYVIGLVSPGDRPPGERLVILAGPSDLPLSMVTDQDGSAAFHLSGDIAWENLSMLASPAIARFVVGRSLADGLELRDGSVRVNVTGIESGYHLCVHGTSSAAYLAIVLGGMQSEVLPLRNSAVVFSPTRGSEVKEILLFP